MPQLRLSAIDNRRLFSNYYLENRVPKSQAWRDFDKAREAIDGIKDIYKKKKHWLAKGTERQLRKELIEPILDVINPYYLVDETIPGGLKPDFIFFNTREAKREKRLPDAIAVGDAKAFGTGFDAPLEKKVRSPVRQVYDYFIQSETRWGVLTDGARWRLMLKDVRQEYYFEVDLVDILERYDYDSFRYFYFFFRREAFSIDSKGRCYLDRVIEGSDRYAQEVGEELKERVYKALLALARGFCNWEANALDASDSGVRERVRKNCLVLLYRLLFTFYAEDWGFLPTADARYQEIGLRSRLRHIKHAMKRGPSSIPSELHSYWGSLQNLFELIDNGNEKLGIPPYNGGLFHRTSDGAILGGDDFLDRYTIGNRYIAEAIHLLGTATDPETREEAEVDYSSLESRHLGSIYEGLLEFKLAYAEEPQVIVKRKGKEVWIPLNEYAGKTPADDLPNDRIVERAELYMETEKHERKVTGSYYTPDFVVKYIVENTVGPVVEEKWDTALKEGLPLKDATLSIKVLDPAMGSGHFLVGAVGFLAHKLLEAVESDVEEGHLTEEQTRHCTPDWAKREVVAHCIYGVDLNELAVELAKVSLWLTTISKDKPLSFLDHRLKCGNSLIGANLADLKEYPQVKHGRPRRSEDKSLPEFISEIFVHRLIGKITELEAIGDDNLDDIKRKEQVFEEFRQLAEYEKTKAIADVHTSICFGNEVRPTEKKDPKEVYFDLIYSLDYPSNWEPKTKTTWFKRAMEIAEDKEKKFFHWELEFPEVFFESGGKKENPGFDVVIGNPPYVRQEQLKESKEYLEEAFSTYGSVADLYVYFYETSHRLLRRQGHFGMITSNKFMRAAYGEPLREYLTEGIQVREIIDFGDLPVFSDVSAYPCIVLTIKADRNGQPTRYLRVPSLGFVSLIELVDEEAINLPGDALAGRSWQLMSASEREVLEKMRRHSIILKAWLGETEIRRGILTGFNKAFFIDESTREDLILKDANSVQLIKPLVIGDDIRRYEIEFKGRYLIWTYIGVAIEKYPAIFEHLKQFQPQLEKRWDKGDHWWELRHCDYYGDFETPKIIFGRFMDRPLFGFDVEGKYFTNDAMYIAAIPDGYPVTVLNSRLGWFWLQHKCTDLRGKYIQVFVQDLEVFPIRRITFTTPKEERERLKEQQRQLCQDFFESGDSTPVLDLVERCMPKDEKSNFIQEEEKSDVVYDLLAFLGEQMMVMNKERRKQTELFYTDIEGVVDEETFKILQKGKHGRSLYERESCRAYVQEDSYATYRLDAALVWSRQAFGDFVKLLARRILNLSDIMAIHDRYHPELKELQERIEKTDELIDQIVYRLYGLTDEETRIVEGSF